MHAARTASAEDEESLAGPHAHAHHRRWARLTYVLVWLPNEAMPTRTVPPHRVSWICPPYAASLHAHLSNARLCAAPHSCPFLSPLLLNGRAKKSHGVSGPVCFSQLISHKSLAICLFTWTYNSRVPTCLFTGLISPC